MVSESSSKSQSVVSSSPATSTSLLATSVNPSSFAISALHVDDFDPQAFIAERRQHAPLSLIRDELRTYVSSLSSQIVHAVQKDFNQFTNFGPSLADATLLARSLHPGLEKLHSELDSLHTHLRSQADTLQAALAQRHEINNRRNALQTLVSIHDSIIKCERLLRQFSPLTSDILSDSAFALLDRITAETAQLSFKLTRAQPCAFLDSLTVRISSVKRQVRSSLDQCLQRALPSSKPFDSEVLSRVLALYVVAGMQDDAHDFFTRQIVSPFTSQRLRMSVMLSVAERQLQQERKSTTSVTPGDALSAAHHEIVSFLGDRVLPLVSLCSNDGRLAKRLDVIGKSVWPNMQRAISTQMGPAFSPGIPDVFHRSFQAGADIFAAIEAAASDEFRDSLRESATTVEFAKHWNLPVYFQLRFQEISSTFESNLAKGPIAIEEFKAGSKSSGSGTNSGTLEGRVLRTDVYESAAAGSLVASLRRCWGEDVFLMPLTHRFMRLSLQLLARYATWVRTGLAGEWSGSGSDPISKGAARVIHDVNVLQTRLPAELASILRVRCPSMSSESIDGMETAFSEAVERFATLIPELVTSISDAIATDCVENLQPLRGSIATYRMSSKQAPTTYTSFVPKILRPLRAFVKDHEKMVCQGLRMDIAKAVVDRTSQEYFSMATELVERNKSNEATLRRLNIGRSGASSTGSDGLSVVEKISAQMFLDVEQFTDEVAGIGVKVEDVDSLVQLRESVKRERDDGKGRIEDGRTPEVDQNEENKEKVETESKEEM